MMKEETTLDVLRRHRLINKDNEVHGTFAQVEEAILDFTKQKCDKELLVRGITDKICTTCNGEGKLQKPYISSADEVKNEITNDEVSITYTCPTCNGDKVIGNKNRI